MSSVVGSETLGMEKTIPGSAKPGNTSQSLY